MRNSIAFKAGIIAIMCLAFSGTVQGEEQARDSSADAAALRGRPAPALEGAAQLAPQQAPAPAARDLFVRVGKSLVVDSQVTIERVSVADPAVAEAAAVSPREVLVNGKSPGQTSFIIWQQGGRRLLFDLNVLPDTSQLEAVRETIRKELFDQDVEVTFEHGTVFLRGRVEDLVKAERARAIASTLSDQVVNLLYVDVPPVDDQILLQVKFANVDRAAIRELGASYVLTGAFNTQASLSTQQFSPPLGGTATGVSLSEALNVFMFRPDIDFGVAIKALQSRRLLELLAEPNLLTINGKEASFLAGGEFPVPVLQGGGLGNAITIQYREFGVRLNFVPNVTPRGTIRLGVQPEVSSLDFANGLIFQGFNIPALSTRRVQTEIELESGQSFAIAGLLDNRVTETFSKIPGLGDIPFFGKLFRSQALAKNNSELLIMVTPEVVRPMARGAALPEIEMPQPFLEGARTVAPRTPGIDQTGPVPVTPPRETLPVEQLLEIEGEEQASPVPATMPVQLVPVPVAPAPSAPAPAPPPAGPPDQ